MVFKSLLAIAVLLFADIASTRAAEPLQGVRVADNGRYFVKADGTPFFWLGDTAWSIFNHPTIEDVDTYLDDRASKGFTVIQGCLVLWDGLRRAPPDGQLPFIDGDPRKMNEAFFARADSIIDKAAERGMYMAILPVWIKAYISGERYRDTLKNPEAMKSYCKFLGQRYGKKNVFWVLGGDWPGRDTLELSNAMAEGLIEGAGTDNIMITYHPTGRQSSSMWFHEAKWLDFNAIQSGHFINTTNFQLVADDFAKTPVKPTLDTEPGYENITDRLIRNNPDAGRIKAVDVRRSAYLAVFAGAAGHTYGNGEVYEFWSPGGRGPLPGWGAGLAWKESLQLPGSAQLQHLRWLIESRPMLDRVPDQSLVADSVSNRAVERIAATRAADGSYAFVYLPTGQKRVKIRTSKLSGDKLNVWWYDPRTGKPSQANQITKTDSHEFTAPHEGSAAAADENDCVLVLDDASKNYAAPGTHAKKPTITR